MIRLRRRSRLVESAVEKDIEKNIKVALGADGADNGLSDTTKYYNIK
jgi:hypothetical protein